MTLRNAIFTFILGFLTFTTQAQVSESKPFVLGSTETFISEQLSEKRTLNVYLPEGYHPDSAKTYPVVYLLDGSANEDFVHIAGLMQFCNMMEIAPKMIVVGIANVDRKRDFTFPTSIAQDKKDFPTTGGSAKFIDFIAKELQPFVQKKYKTNGTNLLIGQSLGGLLATEILLKKPSLFHKYLILSPSLWWNDQSLLKQAPQLLATHSNEAREVFVSVGTEGKIMEADAKALAEVLSKAGKPQMKVHFVPLPDENHATILHESIYRIFRQLGAKK